MAERIKDNYKKYYEIEDIEPIGFGGFGYILKGREKKSKELRAIKVIDLTKLKAQLKLQDSYNFEKEKKNLMNEFENMKKCSENNNSVKCYEYFLNEQNFVIIMELCDTNLEKWLLEKYTENKEERGFNDKEIYEILIQLNKILKIMNKNNIVHRDMKPDNILVKFEKEHKGFIIKLADYGSSKSLKILSSTKMITTKVGTLPYMSPEILKGEEYNYKCDLWSLGIIIYRLYFFKFPFSGKTSFAILNNLKRFFLKSTNNENLDDLIRKLLQEDKNKRLNWEEYFNHPFFKRNNKFNLIYEKNINDDSEEIIFGNKFVENNKNNIELIINNEKKNLIEKYKLKKGENKIQIIIKGKITNLEDMFKGCKNLKYINELNNLDTKNINNFSGMFEGCSSLSNLNGIENWNVSNGKDFSHMFDGCSSLSNIDELKNWDVSNGINFSFMFCECSSLKNLNGLKNWTVSKGKDFCHMFEMCSSLPNIDELKNWDVSQGKDFLFMFDGCSSLSNIDGVINWKVFNGNNFSFMFSDCSSLSNIDGLEKWDVSSGNNFSFMFDSCSSLQKINKLENWNVSNGKYFSHMFNECSKLSSIKGLEKWNVSCGEDYSDMFGGCLSLSSIKEIQNWSISNGKYFTYMFRNCSSLSSSNINEFFKKHNITR